MQVSLPTIAITFAGAVFLGGGMGAVSAQTSAGEWPSYAADNASTKYSPLDQIDKDNVGDLEIAWIWKSIEYELAEGNRVLTPSSIFESTPLMVDGMLYTSTGLGRAIAIDPASGETLWQYDPFEGAESPKRPYGIPISRGLSYWSQGVKKRLFLVSEQHLVSLDAETGELATEFWDDGKVDMRKGVEPELPWYTWTSPPMVTNGVVIMGNGTLDQQITKESRPGYIRGYDSQSGTLMWTFNLIPKPGEFGYDTWEDGAAEYTGHANVWTWMTADDELGYVYLPTSTPNNDWYGGHRPGDTLFAESLVCLDVKTGERVWHFQAVHHGVWDYDFPCAPILADITVDGKKIKAVIQPSKQGFLYVFDRVTGEPVWPIEERPVPQSTVPGEKTSPTQPHPTWPKAFDLQGLTEDDLIDFTPELRANALDFFDGFVHGALFTPPSTISTEDGGTKGTFQVPGPVGGANWNGAALDPETNILYIPSVTAPLIASLIQPDQGRSNLRYVRGGSVTYATVGGLPITKPPYGRITAIDLDTGEHVWMVPNGDGPRDHALLKDLDLPPLGQPGRAGPLVTKTLLFVGEGSPDMIAIPPGGGGKMFRAYDKATGEVVSEIELPAGTTGSPMTYQVDGKQFIVVAVGSKDYSASLVALSLP